MKIQLQQLPLYLKKEIASLYLVSGDEFLLVQEACDAIRKHAKESGYTEREVFYIESGSNWEQFLNSINNSSLFGDKALIELRLKGKITDAGKKILQNYANQPAPDKIVLIISNKLDSSQQKTAWFKAVDANGIFLPIWPLEPTKLPLWIANRLKLTGIRTDNQGIQVIVDHVSGNLLAAAQEIEKLLLLYGQGDLTADQISTAVTDNARFNIFNLLDAAINHNIAIVNRIFDNLKNENVEPVIILWAITNELRSLINISFSLQQGINIDQAMKQNGVWYNRKQLVRKMLTKYNLSQLQNFLRSATHIDLIIKGADKQRLLWHELRKFYLGFAGSPRQALETCGDDYE